MAPSPPPSHAPGSEVRGSWELLNQTQETGMGQCVALCALPAQGPRQTP